MQVNSDSDMTVVLFLCTGNSCRSQMAEGLCRKLHGDRIDAVSAGTEKHALNPDAVEVMAEIGIDISQHVSKSLDDIDTERLDCVVTVCGHADASCPVFPGNVQKIHKGFDDPPRLAENAVTREEALAHYRRVRDEIRDYVANLPTVLGEAAN